MSDHMSEADFLDDHYDDDAEGVGVVCDRCGRDGFYWGRARAGYRLFYCVTGKMHSCPEPKP